MAGAEAHPEVPHALAHALPRWHVHERVALTATTQTHRRELELLEGVGSVGELPQRPQPQRQRRAPSVMSVSTREKKSATKVWTPFDIIRSWTPAEPFSLSSHPAGVSSSPNTQLESRPRRTVNCEALRSMTPLQKLEVEKRQERVCKERASKSNGPERQKAILLFNY